MAVAARGGTLPGLGDHGGPLGEPLSQLGAAAMVDRSSRSHHCPWRIPTRTERRIIKVRVVRRSGLARTGYLGLRPSTVHRLLARWRLARLAWLDRASGRAVRRDDERAAPGDLVHVDIKKLGRIPDGGGWAPS